MILYLKDPKNSTQKLLDIINSYSKVAGYKINIEKKPNSLYKTTITLIANPDRDTLRKENLGQYPS
jgi:hypothetical protein